jgi:type II secretory pathway predicted ATPase ExeA
MQTMYQAKFGLRHRPFPVTPDPASYYPATSHERAMSRLLRGLEEGEGVLLLTGEAGTGKTLLCHCLLERLSADAATALLTAGHYDGPAGLLQSVLFDLSLPYQGLREQEMRLALMDNLLKTFKEGRRTVIVIDEAHHLDAGLLEEVRLWGNLEARAGKVLQVVLVGQPSLAVHLRAPELASLQQRLVVRTSIEPLPVPEAADYLFHHLRAAGGRPERILGDEAAELLARRSGGIPRVLNQVAHQALALASDAGAAEVDVEITLEALSLLGLAVEEEGGEALVEMALEEPALEEPAPLGASEPASTGPASEQPAGARATAEETSDPACRLFMSTLDAS